MIQPLIIALAAGAILERFREEDSSAAPMIAPARADDRGEELTFPEGLNQPTFADLRVIEVAPRIDASVNQLSAIAYLNTLRRLLEESDPYIPGLQAVREKLKTTIDVETAIDSLRVGMRGAKLASPLGPVAAPVIGTAAGFVSWIAACVSAAQNWETVATTNQYLARWWCVVRARLGPPPRSLMHFFTGIQVLAGRPIRHGLSEPFNALQWTAAVIAAIQFCQGSGVTWDLAPYWDPSHKEKANRGQTVPLVTRGADQNIGPYHYRAGYRNPGFVSKDGTRYRGYYWDYALFYDYLFLNARCLNYTGNVKVQLGPAEIQAAYLRAYNRRARGLLNLGVFSRQDNEVFVAELLRMMVQKTGLEGLRWKHPAINVEVGRAYPDGVRDDGGWRGSTIIRTEGQGMNIPPTLVTGE